MGKIQINAGGVIRDVKYVQRNISGVIKESQKVQINNSGVITNVREDVVVDSAVVNVEVYTYQGYPRSNYVIGSNYASIISSGGKGLALLFYIELKDRFGNSPSSLHNTAFYDTMYKLRISWEARVDGSGYDNLGQIFYHNDLYEAVSLGVHGEYPIFKSGTLTWLVPSPFKMLLESVAIANGSSSNTRTLTIRSIDLVSPTNSNIVLKNIPFILKEA